MRPLPKVPIYAGMTLCAGLLIATVLDRELREAVGALDADAGVMHRQLDENEDEGALFSNERVERKSRSSHISRRNSTTGASSRRISFAAADRVARPRNMAERGAADTLQPGKRGQGAASSASSASFEQALAPIESFPSRRKLERMAQRAERRANRELDRLVETLDLNENQQQVVFEILARSSDDFLPVMSTDSDLGAVVEPLLESTESIEEAIEVVLDEDQTSMYNEELEEKRAWWWATLRDFIPDEELPEVVEESESYVP